MADYIDRDELLKHQHDINGTEMFFATDIVNAPTVEALPINRLAEIMVDNCSLPTDWIGQYIADCTHMLPLDRQTRKDCWKEFFKHYEETEK